MSPTPDRTLDDPQQTIADLKRQLAERTVERDHLRSERDEALGQQTATAEVLQVINSSPGDLTPVFDALLDKAMRLCDAAFGVMRVSEGEQPRTVRTRGVPAAYAEFLMRNPVPADEGGISARNRDGEPFVHTVDLKDDDRYRRGVPTRRAMVDLGGARTSLSMALRNDRDVVGAIHIYRQEVRPFSDKQIALLQNFAAMAVIAMENARLITETREALEQQTATAEVLQVINASPGELGPVFDAMLDKATRLCEASFGGLATFDGEFFSIAAWRSAPPALVEAEAFRQPFPPNPGGPLDRLLRGEWIVQIANITAEEGYRFGSMQLRAMADLGGARTMLWAALRKDDALLGLIAIYRQEVRPFSDKQIALLQSFAAQAVIAMENARLITETHEALEQQTATAEVLGVINSSPGDLGPVFDAMLEKATRLCDAPFGTLRTWDGERFHFGAVYGDPQLSDWVRRRGSFRPDGGPLRRIMEGEQVVQVADASSGADYSTSPGFREMVEASGRRSAITVALRKDGALLGTIAVYRQEVRPFSDKQIALLENFAAQAVIAMENARLITETREALEQQTATAEVLGVINSSPGDLAPVFDAMLERAMRLCEAAFGSLLTYDGERFHAAVLHQVPARYAEFLREPLSADAGIALTRIVKERTIVQIPDAAAGENYHKRKPLAVAGVELGGVRTLIVVPLVKEDTILGVFYLYRQEVRPFSDKQIALLQNFAAQAVIAMENARLITETREALEQQTATAEVLGVINSSPGDLAPVFDAMLDKAMRLCGAVHGTLTAYDGEHFRCVASHNLPQALFELLSQPRRAAPNSPQERLLRGERIVHIADMAEVNMAASPDDQVARAAAEIGFTRTVLFVPLRKDNTLLGYIGAQRHVVRPFTDKQIALLENFAAQAVIAMENARLITETREALEQQTATADVLQVINSSPGDLVPVFDAILEKAHTLCEAAFGTLMIRDGERFYAAVAHGVPAPFEEVLRRGFEPHPGTPLARLLDGEPLVHIPDLAQVAPLLPDDPVPRAGVELGGTRTLLMVPLVRDQELLGAITAYRQEVRPFSDKQIALLQNFAAQAVIAMENARLITETREALEQQTATAEVLGVINSSPGDLAPVFDAILEKAHSLCGADRGILAIYDGEHARAVATQGVTEPLAGLLRQPFRPLPNSPHARLVREQCVVHISDLEAEPLWERDDPKRIATTEGGVRTMLFVPLRKDDVVLGWIAANRPEVRPFSDKEIALLESFAAQAVIAMDNARLLNEIHQRQAELRVTFDNMGDGVAMFDGELRLAAWNLNFQRILDLPDALLAERPSYADYIRFLAERGEFGTEGIAPELSRRLEATEEELRLERTRPDGSIVEIRRNAVPGGEFVVIYGDVTERKRAEEQIRAARDTAERALQELKTTQASLLHAQKMAALGQLTAGIAHEIKNPLNFVNNFAGLSVDLLDELKDTVGPAIAALDENKRAEADEVVGMLTGNLEKIAEHGKRADGIVTSMLAHSRGSSGERQSVDINGLVEEALNLAYHGARAQDQSFNITLERDLDRDIARIELVPQEVTRVFLNLFGNGFYAASKRRRECAALDFRPALKVATRDLGEAVEIRVRDNGTGIPTELRDKLFQPFFTTKPTGEGTGLGLSISWDIVTQQHGGTIAVDSEVGEFTEFTIRLPRQLHRSGMTA